MKNRWKEAVWPASTETQSLEADVEPDAVFAVLADPERLPEWAPGFADSVGGNAEEGWRVAKAGQAFSIRVAVNQLGRSVDYLREPAPGREGSACLRVLPGPRGGSVIVMTLPLRPGNDPGSIAATIKDELTALVRLAQRPHG